jgi:hypothetical protein
MIRQGRLTAPGLRSRTIMLSSSRTLPRRGAAPAAPTRPRAAPRAAPPRRAPAPARAAAGGAAPVAPTLAAPVELPEGFDLGAAVAMAAASFEAYLEPSGGGFQEVSVNDTHTTYTCRRGGGGPRPDHD